jgi:rod shape determining protein RodA
MISRLLTFLGRHIDRHLLAAAAALMLVGLITLYSASGESLGRVAAQLANIVIALCVMWLAANIPPHYLQRLALPVYLFGLILLFGVAGFGEVVNGARRWLHVGVTRIQPSELMKVAVPMALAWYFNYYEERLKMRDFAVAAVMLVVPVLLIAKQPDLGTALLITAAGFFVIFLAGLSWKILTGLTVAMVASMPLLWSVMHDYQRQRILTLLDPNQDPLGAGYHTIQATIALGSGGFFGKGWLNGTQAHLDFLPERSTDFIFAVFSEEFGLFGNLVLVTLFLFVIGRGMFISFNASTLFTRPPRGGNHAHLLHLRFRQHGDGQRHSPGGGCAPAAGELWRHLARQHPVRHRHPDEYSHPQAAGEELICQRRTQRFAPGASSSPLVRRVWLPAPLRRCGPTARRGPAATTWTTARATIRRRISSRSPTPSRGSSQSSSPPQGRTLYSGTRMLPMAQVAPYKARGMASWYGKRYHSQATSSGEIYDMYAMTAAHPTLPIPSYARVTNLRNGKSVVVRINDRGPFRGDRLIDLSYAAAYKLGIVSCRSRLGRGGIHRCERRAADEYLRRKTGRKWLSRRSRSSRSRWVRTFSSARSAPARMPTAFCCACAYSWTG